MGVEYHVLHGTNLSYDTMFFFKKLNIIKKVMFV